LALLSRYAHRRLGDPERGIEPADVRMRRLRDKTDYHHRHFVNLAATAFLLVIGIAIIWTARAFYEQESLNRCILSGRRNCIEIAAPSRTGVFIPVLEQHRR
jgi:hypothetical protein